jgi:hypothetical protein
MPTTETLAAELKKEDAEASFPSRSWSRIRSLPFFDHLMSRLSGLSGKQVRGVLGVPEPSDDQAAH